VNSGAHAVVINKDKIKLNTTNFHRIFQSDPSVKTTRVYFETALIYTTDAKFLGEKLRNVLQRVLL